MTTGRRFQELIRDYFQPLMKAAGYRKKGAIFRREMPGTVQMVSLQKSRRTTKTEVVFTVNLGIASYLLLTRKRIEPNACTIEDCHWRERLRSPENGSDEHWWVVNDDESARRVGAEVVDWLGKYGLPLLDKYGTEAALRDLWLSGQSPGLTEPQRLVNLSVLLSGQGSIFLTSQITEEIREMARRQPLPILVERLEELDESQ